MTLKIKTKTIDLEYTSNISGITEAEKKHILELLDKAQAKETTSNSTNNNKTITTTTTTEDLAELVDTLYSRTQLINTPQFEQFSNKQLERTKKLENLAKILAEEWYYGDLKPISTNEKEMLSIMKDLGLYRG